VAVYETNKTLRAICGCGIPTDSFRELAVQHGLVAGDYILWKSKELIVDADKKQRHIPMTGLCTFDKLRFMADVYSRAQARFYFSKTLQPEDFKNYDLIVDATGTRAVLGKLPTDKYYSTYQVKAEFNSLPYPDFYMKFPAGDEAKNTKFLWLFPLSDTLAYVGCGSTYGKEAYRQVQQFINEHHAEILEEQAKLLRLNPPQESLPFYNGKIVGVGNSVGAITSFGEGNQLAAETVNLLSQNLRNLPEYQKRTLKLLNWLKHDYNAYTAMTQNKTLKTALNMMKLQRIYAKRFRIQYAKLIKNMF
jgi:flavin-dependent dehydrogenase